MTHSDIPLDPVSKDAAMALAGGERFEPRLKPSVLREWEHQPPVRTEIPGCLLANGTFVNLTGRRQGRLTVIGLDADKNSAWICRCDCGRFEERTARAIRNAANFGDRCRLCREAAFVRAEYEFSKTGREIDKRKL